MGFELNGASCTKGHTLSVVTVNLTNVENTQPVTEFCRTWFFVTFCRASALQQTDPLWYFEGFTAHLTCK